MGSLSTNWKEQFKSLVSVDSDLNSDSKNNDEIIEYVQNEHRRYQNLPLATSNRRLGRKIGLMIQWYFDFQVHLIYLFVVQSLINLGIFTAMLISIKNDSSIYSIRLMDPTKPYSPTNNEYISNYDVIWRITSISFMNNTLTLYWYVVSALNVVVILLFPLLHRWYVEKQMKKIEQQKNSKITSTNDVVVAVNKNVQPVEIVMNQMSHNLSNLDNFSKIDVNKLTCTKSSINDTSEAGFKAIDLTQQYVYEAGEQFVDVIQYTSNVVDISVNNINNKNTDNTNINQKNTLSQIVAAQVRFREQLKRNVHRKTIYIYLGRVASFIVSIAILSSQVGLNYAVYLLNSKLNSFVTALLLAIILNIVNFIWYSVAHRVTLLEQHQTIWSLHCSAIIKSYLFKVLSMMILFQWTQSADFRTLINEQTTMYDENNPPECIYSILAQQYATTWILRIFSSFFGSVVWHWCRSLCIKKWHRKHIRGSNYLLPQFAIVDEYTDLLVDKLLFVIMGGPIFLLLPMLLTITTCLEKLFDRFKLLRLCKPFTIQNRHSHSFTNLIILMVIINVIVGISMYPNGLLWLKHGSTTTLNKHCYML